MTLALSSLQDSTICKCYGYCSGTPHSPSVWCKGAEAGEESLPTALIAEPVSLLSTTLHLLIRRASGRAQQAGESPSCKCS